MKLYKKLLIIIMIGIFISAAVIMHIYTKEHKVAVNTKASVPNQLTEKQKLDDFEYMYTVLKENYPFFQVNVRMNNVDWLAKKAEYKMK